MDPVLCRNPCHCRMGMGCVGGDVKRGTYCICRCNSDGWRIHCMGMAITILRSYGRALLRLGSGILVRIDAALVKKRSPIWNPSRFDLVRMHCFTSLFFCDGSTACGFTSNATPIHGYRVVSG